MKKKISKNVKRILELIEGYDVDINYGLAPNPFGFSFVEDSGEMSLKERASLSFALGDLSKDEEEELKKILYK